ncbi:hypothetical protein RVR_5306 [Actinacidiphila reveromycinica]|uniref:Uncharacterized protein n=1 Tax=Actinacidiphila reveromycinica TaxID=659352 RepID=A0A7U3UUC7_9ACTN|nr:hypothetical protein RVR_5306 [Streptomyces sp. SN-593]
MIGQDRSTGTVQVALSTLTTSQVVDLHEPSAASAVSIPPLPVVLLPLPRHIVAGVERPGVDDRAECPGRHDRAAPPAPLALGDRPAAGAPAGARCCGIGHAAPPAAGRGRPPDRRARRGTCPARAAPGAHRARAGSFARL